MSHYETLAFSSPEELAARVANEWLRELETRTVVTEGETPSVAGGTPAPLNDYCVALSGGRIARQFFSAVVEQAKLKKIEWAKIHFFWGDERCVPPSDPESNFGIARDLLLQPMAIPETQIHRIHGEDPPELGARNAAAELCRIAHKPSASSSSPPILDLIFLGMGEDGHVASLFPSEPEEAISNPAIYRPVIASKPPPHRITVGYSTIAAAREVWVLAAGSGKEDALRQSLLPSGQTPLARVLQSRTATRIFSDLTF